MDKMSEILVSHSHTHRVVPGQFGHGGSESGVEKALRQRGRGEFTARSSVHHGRVVAVPFRRRIRIRRVRIALEPHCARLRGTRCASGWARRRGEIRGYLVMDMAYVTHCTRSCGLRCCPGPPRRAIAYQGTTSPGIKVRRKRQFAVNGQQRAKVRRE